MFLILTLSLKVDATINVVDLVHLCSCVHENSLFLLANDFVADEVLLAFDQTVELEGLVRDCPVDELLEPSDDVLENDDEGESSREDFPVVSWTLVFVWTSRAISELWIATDFHIED